MSLAIIIGIGITIFLLAYIMFKLKTDVDSGSQNHFILQLILLFFIVGLLSLLGKATLDTNTTCEQLLVNSTVVGDYDVYNYELVCSDNTVTTAFSFYKAVMWAVRIIYMYIFLYIAYEVLKYLGVVVPK